MIIGLRVLNKKFIKNMKENCKKKQMIDDINKKKYLI